MQNSKANFTRLCLINYEMNPLILGIFITDGSLQVSKKLGQVTLKRVLNRFFGSQDFLYMKQNQAEIRD